jgi:hypothetical protein
VAEQFLVVLERVEQKALGLWGLGAWAPGASWNLDDWSKHHHQSRWRPSQVRSLIVREVVLGWKMLVDLKQIAQSAEKWSVVFDRKRLQLR